MTHAPHHNQKESAVIALEGARCAELPAHIADKYFSANINTEAFLARTALAICAQCPAMEQCRDEALAMRHLPRGGVIGGAPVAQFRAARAWRRYEHGHREQPPQAPRPSWLTLTEAGNHVEEQRMQTDPDEPADYQFPQDAGEAFRPISYAVHAPSATAAPRAPRAPQEEKTPANKNPAPEIDVPVKLDGALCAAMPSELRREYFDANLHLQRAKAGVAMTVCAHCPVLIECRDRALNASSVRKSGVIAGIGARQLERGRVWRRYEWGSRGQTPAYPRPAWLDQPLPSAAAPSPDIGPAAQDHGRGRGPPAQARCR